jgi:hypothetical protein
LQFHSEYNWNLAVLVIQEGDCKDGTNQMQERLGAINVTVAEYIPIPGVLTDAVLVEVLTKIKDRGRSE